MDPALAKNYREILAGSDSAEVLQKRATRIIARAVTAPPAALTDHMDQLLHWYQLGSQNSEEKVRRRSFAWVVAIAKTAAPDVLDQAISDEIPLINLDVPLFYSGYSASDPKSIVRHVSAAGLRLTIAFCKSFASMPAEIWDRAKQIFTIESIKTLAVLGALWAGANVLAAKTAIGIPILAVVNFLLSAYGLWSIWGELQTIGGDVLAFFTLGFNARSDDDLEQAGQALARAFGGGLITAFEVWLMNRAFRAAEGFIARRVRTPGRLQAEYERALKERESSKSKAERVLDAVVSGARGEAMRDLANRPDDVTTAAAVLGGVVLVGGLAVTAYALSGKGES